jgi:hypothetical protein
MLPFENKTRIIISWTVLGCKKTFNLIMKCATYRILIVSLNTVAVVQKTMKEKSIVQIGSACL